MKEVMVAQLPDTTAEDVELALCNAVLMRNAEEGQMWEQAVKDGYPINSERRWSKEWAQEMVGKHMADDQKRRAAASSSATNDQVWAKIATESSWMGQRIEGRNEGPIARSTDWETVPGQPHMKMKLTDKGETLYCDAAALLTKSPEQFLAMEVWVTTETEKMIREDADLEAKRRAFEAELRSRKLQAEKYFEDIVAAKRDSIQALLESELQMYSEYASKSGLARHMPFFEYGVDPIARYLDTLTVQERANSMTRLDDFQQIDVAYQAAKKGDEAAKKMLDDAIRDQNLEKMRSMDERLRGSRFERKQHRKPSLMNRLRATRGFGTRRNYYSKSKAQGQEPLQDVSFEAFQAASQEAMIEVGPGNSMAISDDAMKIIEEAENRKGTFLIRDGLLKGMTKVASSIDSKPLSSTHLDEEDMIYATKAIEASKENQKPSNNNASVVSTSPTRVQRPRQTSAPAFPSTPRHISPYPGVRISRAPIHITSPSVASPRVSSEAATGYTKFIQKAIDPEQKAPLNYAFHAHTEIQRILAAKEQNERYVSVAQGSASILKLPALDSKYMATTIAQKRDEPWTNEAGGRVKQINEELETAASMARLLDPFVLENATIQSMTNRGVAKIVTPGANNPPIPSAKTAPLVIQPPASAQQLLPQPFYYPAPPSLPGNGRYIFYNGQAINHQGSTALPEHFYNAMIDYLQNESSTIRESWTPIDCGCNREPGSYDAEDRFIHLGLERQGECGEVDGHDEDGVQTECWDMTTDVSTLSLCDEHLRMSLNPPKGKGIETAKMIEETAPGMSADKSTSLSEPKYSSPYITGSFPPVLRITPSLQRRFDNAIPPAHLPAPPSPGEEVPHPSSPPPPDRLLSRENCRSVLHAVLLLRLSQEAEDERLDNLEIESLGLSPEDEAAMKKRCGEEREKWSVEEKRVRRFENCGCEFDCCPVGCSICCDEGREICECVEEGEGGEVPGADATEEVQADSAAEA